MYGKIFAQMYDGTLGTNGPWQALVTFQQMIVLADKDGTVDMTAEALSRRTTIPVEIITHGLAELEKADTESRTPDEDGRRIARVSDDRPWGWRIVNYDKYRKIRSEEDRRAYQREYWRTKRSPGALNTELNTSTPITQTQPIVKVKAEADTKEKKQRAPKDGATWLTPYLLAWESKNGAGSGVAIAGRLAKALKPLHDANGEGPVLGKLAIYLSQTDAQFRSPQAFAQRFSSWGEVSAPVATKQQQSTAALTGWLNQQEPTDGLLNNDSGNARVLRRALPRRADFGSDG